MRDRRGDCTGLCALGSVYSMHALCSVAPIGRAPMSAASGSRARRTSGARAAHQAAHRAAPDRKAERHLTHCAARGGPKHDGRCCQEAHDPTLDNTSCASPVSTPSDTQCAKAPETGAPSGQPRKAKSHHSNPPTHAPRFVGIGMGDLKTGFEFDEGLTAIHAE